MITRRNARPIPLTGRWGVRLRTCLAALVLVAVTVATAGAQSIFTNPITDTNPSSANPYTNGQTVDANLTVSGIGRGAGIAGSSAANRYSANGFDTSSTLTLSNNDYFTFTLTPKTGYVLNLTSFTYTSQVSSGTPSLSFRSSVDSFASSIGTATVTGTTISLSGTAYQNLSGAIEFRMYGYNFAASTTTFSINDFTFNGSVTAVGGTASGNYFGTTGQGYNTSSTVFDTTTADFNSKNDGTGTAKAYDNTQAAVFAGTAGTVTVASGGLTVGAGLQFGTTGYELTGGTLTFASGGNAVLVSNSGDTTTISSPLAGTVGITKSGAGKLILTGANGNTGTFTTTAGTLEFNNGNNNLTSLAVTGGTAQIDAGSQVTLTNGSVPVSTGAALIINGTLLNNSTTPLSTETGTVTVASGGMVIQQGAGSPTSFLFTGTTPAVFQPGSTFVFRDYTSTPTVSNRTYTGNLTFDSTGGAAVTVGTGVNGSSPFTVNGDLTIGTGVTLPYAAGYTLTNVFKGNITVNGNLGGTNGTQSITVLSGKTLTVGSGGTLAFAAANATTSLPAQTLTVNAGAMLTGLGTITTTGTTLVNGTLAPGAVGMTGTLTHTGALTLGGGSTLAFDIVNTGTHDLVTLGTSVLTINSATLALTLPNTTATGIDYTGIYPIFTSVSSVVGGFGSVTGFDSTDYVPYLTLNGSEYDLTFVPVPEPTTVLGGALLIGAAGWSQRRRLRGRRRAA